MIVVLIVACEVGFWVLLALGLALRYLARMPRTGAVVLLMEPLLELVLLIVTAIDLKNGAPADWKHGLAAVYIGFTVAYGHYTIKWVDGHFAHRFAGGPRPVKRYGLARAKHEGKLWVRTVVMAAVAAALLQLATWYVGDGGDTRSLHEWQLTALRIVAVHGVIALTYLIWQKKDPGRTTADEEAARPPQKTLG
ncbi:hypothetical protein OG301_26420 [Streptomyces platensis]|uniref:hypothetical protein n=1 Tax=Streptomyces platensis TaxID=58346 RepID=UPI002E121DA6|nr:hypothetical protein OG229_12005 [Streptomyces platensis]WTI54611.1 hypothetical protein OG301_26420 [Streptomyces platensis]WUB79782.1 hypothetical protein OG424_11680 [Streptomyces platensis]